MVLDLLGKCIGQAGKAAHLHTHRQVLAFNVRSADVAKDRIA